MVDWATSVVAMGRVQQLKREGKPLPADGRGRQGRPARPPTPTPPSRSCPFGAHKGYGLALINELVGAFIGGSLPTIRNRWADDGDKHTCAFFFQVIHPDAMNAGAFARGRTQAQNVKAVIADILGHGNEKAMLPGQIEAEWAKRTAAAGGLLFSRAEIEAFNELAAECGRPAWAARRLQDGFGLSRKTASLPSPDRPPRPRSRARPNCFRCPVRRM